MAIKVVTNPVREQDKSPKSTSLIEIVFFVALNLFVVPFSAYQTYIGYRNDVAGGEIQAIVIAIISGLLFAAMNFGIRERRVKRKSHILQTLLYVVPLGFSFFGNFNAFYSTQMRSDLYQNEILNYQGIFNTTVSNARTALGGSLEISILKSSLSTKQTQLTVQYGLAGASGWGSNCESQWKDIEILFSTQPEGVRLTTFSRHYLPLINAINISNKALKDIIRTRTESVSDITKKIDDFDSNVNAMIARTRVNETWQADGRGILDSLIQSNNGIGIAMKTHAKIGSFTYTTLNLSQHAGIGTIKHSITSGFIKRDNPTAAFFAVFLSLIIDLCALFYILLFIPFEKVGKRQTVSGPRKY